MALPLQFFSQDPKLTGTNDYAGHATPQAQNTFRARNIECALNHTIINGPGVGVEDLHASLNIEKPVSRLRCLVAPGGNQIGKYRKLTLMASMGYTGGEVSIFAIHA